MNSPFRTQEVGISKPGKILRNRAQCLNCKEVIESEYTHDFKFCRCGAIAVDGGHDYIRRLFDSPDILRELSEYD